MASRRETGGVVDCGTAEEDGPVTWEVPVRPRCKGLSETWLWESDCGPAGNWLGYPPNPTAGAPRDPREVRHGRGQTGGMPKRQGSRRAAYER
jgi:hypothetical protein